ncbi:MAG TPA: hypothetical protein VMV33_07005 [Rhodocyclaceae bacterium]|nr:hypothetical protein [Rhodocyclaceae bacterium]
MDGSGTTPPPGRGARWRLGRLRPWFAAPATLVYIGAIAVLAHVVGLAYILFPELGALSHDIFKRPHGAWARAPVQLVLTPAVTALLGTLLTRHLAYGPAAVLLSVGSSILVIRLLRSPIAPAISAGLLPLALGIRSWLYAPSILIGTVALALLSLPWRRLMPPARPTVRDLADDITERTPSRYAWVTFFLGFVAVGATIAALSGQRLLLYPPLVVMGFEMFAHPNVCPWARRPLLLPLVCVLTATGGVALVALLGVGPLAAVGSILIGIAVLAAFDLHAPPALAVGLLPFVIARPGYVFPVAVGCGTLLLSLSFLLWRWAARRRWTAA